MDAAYKFAEDDGDYLQLVERAASRCGAGLNAICAGSAADPGSGGGAMKFGLVNPAWTYEGSTYFGCQDPHYPLELLFAFDQIKQAGHEPLLLDAHVEKMSTQEVKTRLEGFNPDFLVIPTAPSYLFWRCPPPELRVPQKWFAELGSQTVKVAIGPHPSATPGATLRKLNCDVALRGEPDETLPLLASRPWTEIDGCCWRDQQRVHL